MMNEFSLIDTYFKSLGASRTDILLGIGDDAACVNVPNGHQLLVSTDTLVSEVHFFADASPEDIAYKALMANISDIVAMGGEPAWATLALTMPTLDTAWLEGFSAGLRAGLSQYQVGLIGGDTTHGSLSITITIHGLVPEEKAIRRDTAKPGDVIMVSGPLGAAALAVERYEALRGKATYNDPLLTALYRPAPRVDWVPILQEYATAAIDISDGLAADLTHICESSALGATIALTDLPIHDSVKALGQDKALPFALYGGDDYELCFTVAEAEVTACEADLEALGHKVYPIGKLDQTAGLSTRDEKGIVEPITPRGYTHF